MYLFGIWLMCRSYYKWIVFIRDYVIYEFVNYYIEYNEILS